MDARATARWHACGRIAVGSALTVAPGLAGRGWIGSHADGLPTQVFTRALGARDLGMGLATVRALGQGFGARPWLQAGVLADAVDMAGTLAARRELGAARVVAAATVAGGSALFGVWLARSLD